MNPRLDLDEDNLSYPKGMTWGSHTEPFVSWRKDILGLYSIMMSTDGIDPNQACVLFADFKFSRMFLLSFTQSLNFTIIFSL
jgi:hypothetical protein